MRRAIRMLGMQANLPRGAGPTVQRVACVTGTAREPHAGRSLRLCQLGLAFGAAAGERRASSRLCASGSGPVVVCELPCRGHASRALEAMLAWGARELGLREAGIACHVDNVASRRVAETCAASTSAAKAINSGSARPALVHRPHGPTQVANASPCRWCVSLRCPVPSGRIT